MAVDLKTIAPREATAFGGQPKVTRHWDDAEFRWVDVLACEDLFSDADIDVFDHNRPSVV